MEQRERQEAAQEPQTHPLRHTYHPQHISTHTCHSQGQTHHPLGSQFTHPSPP